MLSQKIVIKGIVQGVGFRPFIWRLANKCNLKGFVKNSGDSVVIKIIGTYKNVAVFKNELENNIPPLADIVSIKVTDSQQFFFKDFTISKSDKCTEKSVRISPDITICNDCKRELFDKNDRRYGYPFINCINCGPRYSIIKELPYDRNNTSMNAFSMCSDCRLEYNDPKDRRYHAQPISCHECGPQIQLMNNKGEKLNGDWEIHWKNSIRKGLIIAIKGIGGFHLACDALNPDVLKKLRNRKKRDNKPFAIMINDINWIKMYCFISVDEEKMLFSKESPIVLLKIKKKFACLEFIAPQLNTIGVMIPYTPLHLQMMKQVDGPIILTSANYINEPMINDNNDALRLLKNVADMFIMHDRRIINRCDDSVSLYRGNLPTIIRPGRGVSPFSIRIKSDKVAIAFGADLKNTFSLLSHDSITVSPYIGDLENPQTQEAFVNTLDLYIKSHKIEPEFIFHDKHPDYFSTQLATDFSKRFNIPRIAVQHHHAHLASGYLEHNIKGQAIGFAFDGTGFGLDDTIWGGEVFIFDRTGFSREYHFKKMILPGGDLAVKEPARIAISLSTESQELCDLLKKICPNDYRKIIKQQLHANINCPRTSSIARLFDFVSYILGICDKQTYDGEAAIKLEAIADKNERKSFSFLIGNGIIDCSLMFKEMVELLANGVSIEIIAGRFHNMIIDIIFSCIKTIAISTGILPVVFSGGVFQNRLLVEKIILRQKSINNKLYFSSMPNDSGISVGQAIIGATLIR